MVLTPRQREELKTAVAAFLKEIGADEARKVFIQESEVKNVILTFKFELFPMEHIYSKNSSNSKLYFESICSIRNIIRIMYNRVF